MNEEIKECCGNGCNNCVLDQKRSKVNQSDLDNILDSSYKKFTLISIEKCTKFVFKFTFKYCGDSTEKDCLQIPDGAHLMMRLKCDLKNKAINNQFQGLEMENTKHKRQKTAIEIHDPDLKIGDFISRPYTPIEHDSTKLTFTVLFRYEGGEMSNLITRLQVQDEVEWKGIYGEFKWEKKKEFKNLICFSQGVGIAPIITVIKSILDNDDDETIIHLIACFKSCEDVLLKDKLMEFKKYWNFKLTLYLPYSGCSDKNICELCSNLILKDAIFREKINIEIISKVIVPEKSFYITSGSIEFINLIKGFLIENNVDVSNIHRF